MSSLNHALWTRRCASIGHDPIPETPAVLSLPPDHRTEIVQGYFSKENKDMITRKGNGFYKPRTREEPRGQNLRKHNFLVYVGSVLRVTPHQILFLGFSLSPSPGPGC